MVEIEWKKKEWLTRNLSFLNLTELYGSTKQTNAYRSPRNFKEPNGAVGLGILAAVEQQDNEDPIFRTVVLAISPKSLKYPIPVHDGNLTREREYFYADSVGNDDGFHRVSAVDGNGGGFGMVSLSSVGFGSEMATSRTSDFLTSCFLCKKLLHGLDIFMYRGEKAFCSVECRCQHISLMNRKRNVTLRRGSP